MSILVVDASVVIKWFVKETNSVEALQWQAGPDELHAPAIFLDIEIANILWKKIQRGDLTRAEADRILTNVPALSLVRHSESLLLSPALDLADRYRRSVYDCIYLALADHLNGQMLTADQRLANALMGTPLANRVRHVTDSPPP